MDIAGPAALVAQYSLNPGRVILMNVALGESAPGGRKHAQSAMIPMRNIHTQIAVTDQLKLRLTDVLDVLSIPPA